MNRGSFLIICTTKEAITDMIFLGAIGILLVLVGIYALFRVGRPATSSSQAMAGTGLAGGTPSLLKDDGSADLGE